MKKILFPLKIQFIINKQDGKLTIQSTKIKFNLNLDEYPELPVQSLVNKTALSEQESSEALKVLKLILKNHMKVEES